MIQHDFDSRAPRRAGNSWRVASVGAVAAVAATVGLMTVSDPSSGREGLVWLFAPLMALGAGTAVLAGRIALSGGDSRGRWAFFVGAAIGGFIAIMLLLAGIGRLLGFE